MSVSVKDRKHQKAARESQDCYLRHYRSITSSTSIVLLVCTQESQKQNDYITTNFQINSTYEKLFFNGYKLEILSDKALCKEMQMITTKDMFFLSPA